jgi:putative spermidine/putrescine transport system permease protein
MLLVIVMCPNILILLAPILVVIPMSLSTDSMLSWPPRGMTFHWYGQLFNSPQWMDAAQNSAAVAAVTTIMCLIFGLPAGLALGIQNWRGQSLFLGLSTAPLIFPHIVLAIGMYQAYVQLGLNDFWGLTAGHFVTCVPFVVITAMSGAKQMSPVLMLAARGLGAGPLQVLWYVILPSVRPAILFGAVLAFMTSWDEVVIANYLTTPTFRTIPVQMWAELTELFDPTVAAMASILFAAATALTAAMMLVRKAK